MDQTTRKRDHVKGFMKEVGAEVVEHKLNKLREDLVFEVVECAVKKAFKKKVSKNDHLLGSGNYNR